MKKHWKVVKRFEDEYVVLDPEDRFIRASLECTGWDNYSHKTISVTVYGYYVALSPKEIREIRPVVRAWAEEYFSWHGKPIRIFIG